MRSGILICCHNGRTKNEVADNRFQRSELDWLIYNDPVSYADLILNGELEKYLNAVTIYRSPEQ